MQHVLYHDPLPKVLAHYEDEFVETLAGAGMTAAAVPWARSVEGRVGATGKARMFRDAVLNLRDARRHNGPLIQLWPSLGLPEVRLWSSRAHQRYVVLHDPIPLDRQFGHSALARRWAAHSDQGSRPTVLVHSEAARAEAERLLPNHDVELVLHPILAEQRRTKKTTDPTVLVAGQFKAARNLALLEELGPRLSGAGWVGRIVGRGWPKVPGWQVDAGFVPEDDLDELLGSAWVLLLPYRTYFQSGVAVRALENGTPTLGEGTDFLRQLGASDRMLVPPDAPAQAYLERLEALPSGDNAAAFADYVRRAQASWSELLGGQAGQITS